MGMKNLLLVLSIFITTSLFARSADGLPESISELDTNKNARIDAEEVQFAIEAHVFGDPRFDEKRIDDIIEYYFAQFDSKNDEN